jgi:hypothetical protein
MVDCEKWNSINSISKIGDLVLEISGEELFVSFDEEIIISEWNVHFRMAFR